MSDLISRQKVIKRIEELPNSPNGYSATYDKASIIMAIEDVEPVEFVHAHWIERQLSERGEFEFCCSNCEHAYYGYGYIDPGNYCPNCGAKMDEVSK